MNTTRPSNRNSARQNCIAMNELFTIVVACTFLLGSVVAIAGDNDLKPLSKMETQEARAARDAAKAKWDKMTPEEQAAARKAARAKSLTPVGDFPTRYGDPGYMPTMTPEQREAAARKAAADSEARLKKQAEQKKSE
jgi:hypothetical protein